MSETQAPSKPAPRSNSPWKEAWLRFRRNRRGMLGLSFIVLMLLISLLSPLLANNQPIICKHKGEWYFPGIVEIFQTRATGPHWIEKSAPFRFPQFDAKTDLDPDEFALWPLIPFREDETSPDSFKTPSAEHLLGTDAIGRDLASRMIHATSMAVSIGFLSMSIASIIGITLGAIAGFFGKWSDALISRSIEIVISFPTFFLILCILAWFPPSIFNVMLVIGLTRWTSIARYTRAEFIRLKNLDYVTAAVALGVSKSRIMFRHILPNAMAPVMVSISFGIAGAILIEAGLSWLGFGVQEPKPSWGNILHKAFESLTSAPYMVYPPCIAIFLAVFSFNLVGDALRDAIDPRLKQ